LCGRPSGRILVDHTLNPDRSAFGDLFTNKETSGAPGQVAATDGLTSVTLQLRPLEIRILARS
jgi:hypothetical protein